MTDSEDVVRQILADIAKPSDNGAAPSTDRLRDRLIRGRDVLDLPEPGWVIDRVIPERSLALPYGPPKSGKTFVALDMSMCVATGRPWAGHDTAQGPVIYVAAEGLGGLARRVSAWLEHHDTTDPGDVYWLTQPVNLSVRAEIDSFIEVAADIGPRLIMFDTLARCALGADENSAQDMGTVVAALDTVRNETGAAVCPWHHAGKDVAKGARGSSSLLGAADAIFEIVGGEDYVRFRCTAMKDAEPPYALAFKMIRTGDSIALKAFDAADTAPESVWAVLGVLGEIDTGDGVATGVWEGACESVSRKTFYRARKWLVDAGRVINAGTDSRPRYRVTPKAEE